MFTKLGLKILQSFTAKPKTLLATEQLHDIPGVSHKGTEKQSAGTLNECFKINVAGKTLQYNNCRADIHCGISAGLEVWTGVTDNDSLCLCSPDGPPQSRHRANLWRASAVSRVLSVPIPLREM